MSFGSRTHPFVLAVLLTTDSLTCYLDRQQGLIITFRRKDASARESGGGR